MTPLGQLIRPRLRFAVRVAPQPVTLTLDHLVEAGAEPLRMLEDVGGYLPSTGL